MPTTPATSPEIAPPPSPTVNPNVPMTNEHPLWGKFIDELDAALDTTACKGGESKVLARKILREMGLDKDAVRESCRWFETWGGYCDCEVAMNVVSWWGGWWGGGGGIGLLRRWWGE